MTDGSRFCRACGSPVSANAAFCGNCGAIPRMVSEPEADMKPETELVDVTEAESTVETTNVDGKQTEIGEASEPDPELSSETQSATAPDTENQSAWWRWSLRKLRTASWPSLVVGLLLLGACLSYLVAPRTVEQKVDVIPQGLLATNEGEATMPGLVGMDLNAARVALLDAQVDTTMLKFIRKGAAGSPDRILAQDPESGLGVQGQVYLTISTPIPTPDLIGLDFKEATRKIQSLGGAVRLEQVVEPASKAGTVLSTVPAKAKRLTSVSILRVADPGTAVPLSDLSSLNEEGCSGISDATVGGLPVVSGISCGMGEDPSSIEYATKGVAAAFRASIGWDDEYAVGTAEVRIVTDGSTVQTVTVKPGKPTDIVIPLKGVETLRIEIQGSAGAGDATAYVVLGDAAFSLLPDDVGRLTDGD